MTKITAQDAFDKKLWEQPGHVVSETDIDNSSKTDFIPLSEIITMDEDSDCTGTGMDFEAYSLEDHRGSGCLKATDEVFVYVDYKLYIELEARYENLVRDAYESYKGHMYGIGYGSNEWITFSEYAEVYGLEVADDD